MKNQFPDRYFGTNPSKEIPTKEHVYKKTRSYRKGFLRFVEGLPENAKVLDMGCGSGKAIKTILAIRPDVSVVGIDISDTSDYVPDIVDFHIVGVENVITLFSENDFDAVISHHVIEHLDTPIEMMDNIKKVLKPGGKVFIETPNWMRLIIPLSRLYFWNDYTHKKVFTKKTMARLMRDNNFQIEKNYTTNSIRISDVFKNAPRNPFRFLYRLIDTILHLWIYDVLIVVALNKKVNEK